MPRIDKKQLKCSSISLSEEVCLALHRALLNDKNLVQAITLEDNGLTDEKSSMLLDGLS